MSESKGLFDLIRENPELPIVPMVDTEVVASDEYDWWLAKWGRAEITEYYLGNEGVHFKYDDEEAVLTDMAECRYGCTKDGRDIYELSDEEWDELYKSIPWIKCIAVRITV